MTIYTAFISSSQLISPINGYTCRIITKQNIKQFGFESIEELHKNFPDFPLMCEEYKQTRKNVSNSTKFIKSVEFQKKKYENNPMICPKCSNFIPFKKRKNQFCSRQCANGRQHAEETKLKISSSAKKNPGGVAKWTYEERKEYGKSARKPRKTLKCKTCENDFIIKISEDRIYCSRKCNPNHGGYRKGSGRSNGGYYQGIFCHSTYELVWVMYNLHHDIKFEKCIYYFEYNDRGIVRKYYPDFIQDGVIIEIKGFHTDLVDIKANAVRNKGLDISILYQNDLEKYFNWFKEEYKGKQLQEMYDNYKPQYTYKCDYCKAEFSTNHKRKTDTKFCSRKCCGRFSTIKNNLEGRTGYAPASPS